MNYSYASLTSPDISGVVIPEPMQWHEDVVSLLLVYSLSHNIIPIRPLLSLWRTQGFTSGIPAERTTGDVLLIRDLFCRANPSFDWTLEKGTIATVEERMLFVRKSSLPVVQNTDHPTAMDEMSCLCYLISNVLPEKKSFSYTLADGRHTIAISDCGDSIHCVTNEDGADHGGVLFDIQDKSRVLLYCASFIDGSSRRK